VTQSTCACIRYPTDACNFKKKTKRFYPEKVKRKKCAAAVGHSGEGDKTHTNMYMNEKQTSKQTHAHIHNCLLD